MGQPHECRSHVNAGCLSSIFAGFELWCGVTPILSNYGRTRQLGKNYGVLLSIWPSTVSLGVERKTHGLPLDSRNRHSPRRMFPVSPDVSSPEGGIMTTTYMMPYWVSWVTFRTQSAASHWTGEGTINDPWIIEPADDVWNWFVWGAQPPPAIHSRWPCCSSTASRRGNC